MVIWHAFTGLLKVVFIAFSAWTGNYVLGIVLLTLLVRLVLLPLGIAQARSMQKMALLASRQRELQQRHKGDRQKLNEEVAKLYKAEGLIRRQGVFLSCCKFPSCTGCLMSCGDINIPMLIGSGFGTIWASRITPIFWRC